MIFKFFPSYLFIQQEWGKCHIKHAEVKGQLTGVIPGFQTRTGESPRDSGELSVTWVSPGPLKEQPMFLTTETLL